VRHDRSRLRNTGGLIGMFVAGGCVGAAGFTHVGYVCVVPFAALLLTLAAPPLYRELASHPLRLRKAGHGVEWENGAPR
jgi:hypothetical protein